MIFNISMKMESLLENEQAVRCLDRFSRHDRYTQEHTPDSDAFCGADVGDLSRFDLHQ